MTGVNAVGVGDRYKPFPPLILPLQQLLVPLLDIIPQLQINQQSLQDGAHFLPRHVEQAVAHRPSYQSSPRLDLQPHLDLTQFVSPVPPRPRDRPEVRSKDLLRIDQYPILVSHSHSLLPPFVGDAFGDGATYKSHSPQYSYRSPFRIPSTSPATTSEQAQSSPASTYASALSASSKPSVLQPVVHDIPVSVSFPVPRGHAS